MWTFKILFGYFPHAVMSLWVVWQGDGTNSLLPIRLFRYACVKKEQSYWEGGYRHRIFFLFVVHYKVPSYFLHTCAYNKCGLYKRIFIGVFVLSCSVWDRPSDCVGDVRRYTAEFISSVSVFVFSLLDGFTVLKGTVTINSFSVEKRATAAS